MHILGISGYGSDRAVALITNGVLVAAAREDRFTRVVEEDGFPHQALRWCLAEAGVSIEQIDLVAFAEKPLQRFERALETAVAWAPLGFGYFTRVLPGVLGRRLTMGRELDKALGLKGRRYIWVEQAEAHAATAWFGSTGTGDAAILVMDAAGERASMAWGVGRTGRIELRAEQAQPHNLGLVWAAVARHLGFAAVGGERKVMDLARHGQPTQYEALLRGLCELRDDGSFRLDMDCWERGADETRTSPVFHARFGAPRHPYDPIEQKHKDLAASVQRLHEEVLLRTARHVQAQTKLDRLVLSGSLCANSLANARLVREGPFRSVEVHPSCAGGSLALGAALLVSRQLLGQDGQASVLCGPSSTLDETRAALDEGKATWSAVEREALVQRTTSALTAGQMVAWAQGRAELAQHSLGARCLLADPRGPAVRDRMELRVRFQQGFGALRALVLQERAHEWFEVGQANLTAGLIEVPPRNAAMLPAVVQPNGTVCVQTVDRVQQPELAAVLEAFERATGCAVLATESLALGSGPLALSARDAWIMFMTGEGDALALGTAWLDKRAQRAEQDARRPDPRGATPDNADDDPALRELLRCPACGGAFAFTGIEAASCQGCGAQRVREEGLWKMFQPDAPFDGDITQMVKSFYEAHPFPGYDASDTAQTMVEEARAGIYARQLGEQIPFNGRVLEVGCGTGQLSNYLGIATRTQFGADLCLNSLRLAEGFRSRQRLNHVRLVQMNLFKPCFAPESFDVVLCNGVLLTTSDPEGGFRSIARLVKPGGHIIIGSYNTYGRLGVDTRRQFFRLTGGRMRWVDPYIRKVRMSPEKEDAWFHDQYLHPNETKQSMGEILAWFDRAGIQFVNAVPKTTPWETYTEGEQLFTPAQRGTKFERALVQLQMIKTGNQEGGFFIMIGRKPLANETGGRA